MLIPALSCITDRIVYVTQDCEMRRMPAVLTNGTVPLTEVSLWLSRVGCQLAPCDQETTVERVLVPPRPQRVPTHRCPLPCSICGNRLCKWEPDHIIDEIPPHQCGICPVPEYVSFKKQESSRSCKEGPLRPHCRERYPCGGQLLWSFHDMWVPLVWH